MRTGGAEALAFDVACLAGPEAALPHGSPGDRPVLDRAVLLFSAQRAREYAERWGLEAPPGAFGENLTVDGGDDATVCLGDVVNNWAGRLQRLYAEREVTRTQGWKLAQWFFASSFCSSVFGSITW